MEAAEAESDEDSESESISVDDLIIPDLFSGSNFDMCKIKELKKEGNYAALNANQSYELDVRLFARYMKVYGLFEIKDENNY